MHKNTPYLCDQFNLNFVCAYLISLKEDILNEKTELEATFKEAELAAYSVESLLLCKDTIEEISFENVSTNKMKSQHNIQIALTEVSYLKVVMLIYWYLT